MAGSVLIQKEDGEFVNVNGFNAWRGFDDRGYEIEFASWARMDSGEAARGPGTIVVGSVAFVRRALARLGADPAPLDYPESLRPYLGRAIWRTTWSEIRSRAEEPGRSVFVKPAGADKAFGGHVVGAFRDLIPTARWPREMPLWASEVVPFASEWRYFVRRGEIIGVGHYKGDPLRHPDPAVVRAAVGDYSAEAPSAYGIDFGVVEAGKTHLVEVNDGFSIGCYGLRPLAYSGFLEQRWAELVGPAVGWPRKS